MDILRNNRRKTHFFYNQKMKQKIKILKKYGSKVCDMSSHIWSSILFFSYEIYAIFVFKNTLACQNGIAWQFFLQVFCDVDLAPGMTGETKIDIYVQTKVTVRFFNIFSAHIEVMNLNLIDIKTVGAVEYNWIVNIAQQS